MRRRKRESVCEDVSKGFNRKKKSFMWSCWRAQSRNQPLELLPSRIQHAKDKLFENKVDPKLVVQTSMLYKQLFCNNTVKKQLLHTVVSRGPRRHPFKSRHPLSRLEHPDALSCFTFTLFKLEQVSAQLDQLRPEPTVSAVFKLPNANLGGIQILPACFSPGLCRQSLPGQTPSRYTSARYTPCKLHVA